MGLAKRKMVGMIQKGKALLFWYPGKVWKCINPAIRIRLTLDWVESLGGLFHFNFSPALFSLVFFSFFNNEHQISQWYPPFCDFMSSLCLNPTCISALVTSNCQGRAVRQVYNWLIFTSLSHPLIFHVGDPLGNGMSHLGIYNQHNPISADKIQCSFIRVPRGAPRESLSILSPFSLGTYPTCC